MTVIKERAVEMIKRIPEDDMMYVINILQNLEAMSLNKERDKQKAKKRACRHFKFGEKTAGEF